KSGLIMLPATFEGIFVAKAGLIMPPATFKGIFVAKPGSIMPSATFMADSYICAAYKYILWYKYKMMPLVVQFTRGICFIGKSNF
ncbi:MAG: hypothetical protein WC166_05180, partial [Bacteroidales bacterium]